VTVAFNFISERTVQARTTPSINFSVNLYASPIIRRYIIHRFERRLQLVAFQIRGRTARLVRLMLISWCFASSVALLWACLLEHLKIGLLQHFCSLATLLDLMLDSLTRQIDIIVGYGLPRPARFMCGMHVSMKESGSSKSSYQKETIKKNLKDPSHCPYWRHVKYLGSNGTSLEINV
jgi:hypothetical protein